MVNRRLQKLCVINFAISIEVTAFEYLLAAVFAVCWGMVLEQFEETEVFKAFLELWIGQSTIVVFINEHECLLKFFKLLKLDFQTKYNRNDWLLEGVNKRVGFHILRDEG